MTSAAELDQLDDEELENRLAEYRRELLNLRFQLATSQLDNYSRMSTARRDVARVLTIMREREIALAEGREAGPVTARVRPIRRRAEPVEEVEPEDTGGAEGSAPELEAEGAEELDAEASEELDAEASEGLEDADEFEVEDTDLDEPEDSEEEDG